MSISIRYLSENNEYNQTSRYQVLRAISETTNPAIYLETYNQIEIPVSEDDSYHVVTHAEVNRLDIISNTYYGRPDFWWAIALANNFIDPFVVQEGVMIRIPSTLTLNDPDNRILSR